MGVIKHMLGARKIVPYSGYQHYVMEAAENIHVHWRDTRIQLFPEDFDNFSKYVANAHSKWTEMGKPVQDDRNINLGDPFKCKAPGFFCDRMTVEEQEAGGIHIHWRDTRIHADHGHFIEFATMVQEAHLAFKNIHKEVIKLSEIEHPAVADTYVEWLQDYIISAPGTIDGDSCAEFCREKNLCLASDSPISEDLDRKVLFSIYESIKKYGYARGPFFGDYVVCWLKDDGKVYMAAAHRWAALKMLEYDEVTVCLIRVPEPKQVLEQ